MSQSTTHTIRTRKRRGIPDDTLLRSLTSLAYTLSPDLPHAPSISRSWPEQATRLHEILRVQPVWKLSSTRVATTHLYALTLDLERESVYLTFVLYRYGWQLEHHSDTYQRASSLFHDLHLQGPWKPKSRKPHQENAEKARELYAQGLPERTIAARLSVGTRNLRKILRNESWNADEDWWTAARSRTLRALAKKASPKNPLAWPRKHKIPQEFVEEIRRRAEQGVPPQEINLAFCLPAATGYFLRTGRSR